jgi:hypothetical protein
MKETASLKQHPRRCSDKRNAPATCCCLSTTKACLKPPADAAAAAWRRGARPGSRRKGCRAAKSTLECFSACGCQVVSVLGAVMHLSNGSSAQGTGRNSMHAPAWLQGCGPTRERRLRLRAGRPAAGPCPASCDEWHRQHGKSSSDKASQSRANTAHSPAHNGGPQQWTTNPHAQLQMPPQHPTNHPSTPATHTACTWVDGAGSRDRQAGTKQV